MSNTPDLVQSIISFAQKLVATPSRAFEDDPQDIIDVIAVWAEDNGMEFHKLKRQEGKELGGYFYHSTGRPGKTICLNACIDTCQFGDEETWNYPPASAQIEGDFMYGRGVADSKITVSIFAHIFKNIKDTLKSGDLYVLLDADEHTGNFGGVKCFVEEHHDIDAMFIGYPGNQEIMIGARGFLRAQLDVKGVAEHSGSSSATKENALVKAAQLINAVSQTELPAESDTNFPAGPKVTVTAINGGRGFSQIPDKVTINVDMRLTPSFDKDTARSWLDNIVHKFTNLDISYLESWPCYVLDKNDFVAKILKENAEKELGHSVTLRVCGPSNIGNFLACHDIPAICGFGVDAGNIHGANEYLKLDSINPIYNAYYNTVKSILS